MRRVFAVVVAAAVLGACSSSSPRTASVDASRSTAPTEGPTEGSAEAGFARDMSVHHAQAVAMAEAIRDRTTDPDLKLLATNIALGQQGQIGRMAGWLDEWGLPITSTATPMAWIRSDNLVAAAGATGADSMPGMDMSTSASTPTRTGMHVGSDGRMPGMATRPQVSALSTLPIADAEHSFLQLMIAHHHAGSTWPTPCWRARNGWT